MSQEQNGGNIAVKALIGDERSPAQDENEYIEYTNNKEYREYTNVKSVAIQVETWNVFFTIYFNDGSFKKFRASADEWFTNGNGIVFARTNDELWTKSDE